MPAIYWYSYIETQTFLCTPHGKAELSQLEVCRPRRFVQLNSSARTGVDLKDLVGTLGSISQCNQRCFSDTHLTHCNHIAAAALVSPSSSNVLFDIALL